MLTAPDHCKEACDAFTKGIEELKNKRLKAALDSFTEALDLAGDNAKYLCMRSLVYFELNRFDESLTDALEAVARDPSDANGHVRKALALLLMKETNMAFEAASEGLRKHGGGEANTALMAVQVMALFTQEKYAALLPIARAALQTCEDTDLTKKVAYCLTAAMEKLCNAGEGQAFQLAPEVVDLFSLQPFKFEKSRNVFTIDQLAPMVIPKEYDGMDNADAEAHVGALMHSGTTELDGGDVNMATSLLENSLLVSRAVGLPHREAEAIVILGVAYRMQGKVAMSIDVQQQVLRTLGPKGKVYSGLGNAYYAQGKLHEALEYHKKHLELEMHLASESSGIAMAHNNIACVYTAMGEYSNAAPSFQVYNTYAVHTNYVAGIVTSCNNIASCFLHLRRFDECLEVLQQSLQSHTALYAESTSANQRMAYVYSVRQTYKVAMELYVDVLNYPVAAEIAERSKTLTFIDACSERITKSNEAILSIADMLEVARTESMTMISYNIMSKSKIYAFVICPSGEVHMEPLTWPNDFQWDPVTFFNLLSTDNSSSPGGRTKADRRSRLVLEKLYNLLVLPLERFLPRDSNSPIIIFPHGKLFNVPWNALVDREGRHSIELRIFVVAPCAATFVSNVIARRSAGTAAGKGVAVLDPSIRDSDKERAEFAQLGFTIVDGSAVPASEVVKKLAGASNVHILCRVTCKEVAHFDAMNVGPNFSKTCRTNDSAITLRAHTTPEYTGSLFFGHRDNTDSFSAQQIAFRSAYALSIGALETLPSLKGCMLVTLHAYSEFMEDLYTPKTNIMAVVRAIMASGASCVVCTVQPMQNVAISTRLVKAITEKVNALTNRNMAAMAMRAAIQEAHRNQVPWVQWGCLAIFM